MILGLIEHDRGMLNPLSLEMLTLAQRLTEAVNCPLTAILIGDEAQGLAAGLGAYGVSTVHLVQHNRLNDYAPEAWAQSVVQLIETAQPQAVLAAGTDRGNEVMAHVAARTNLPLAVNCTEVRPGDAYRITRVRWGGSLFEEAHLKGEPKLLTVAPFAIPAEEALEATEIMINPVTPSLTDKDFRVCIKERVEPESGKISLTDANVVIGGGRGVGSAEDFESLEELAAMLDGAVGCSRAVTNNGWRSHADQVGQTGARIAPELYIACGISGAVQHMSGCKGAKRILTVNTDSEAPIIARADYAVIGDLHEVIPAINEALRKMIRET